MTPVRLEPAASRSRVKRPTTEPLHSLFQLLNSNVMLTMLPFTQRWNTFYQLPLILICIVARCLINVVCLNQVMMTLQCLNDVANDAESTKKSKLMS